MRIYSDLELDIMDDRAMTIAEKILKLRQLSSTFWTLDALADFFNMRLDTIGKILRESYAQQN